MVLLALAAAAAPVQQTDAWMRAWLERTGTAKDREYDIATVADFIENCRESGVFSPLCSELNVLLQAQRGEYGGGAAARAELDIGRLADALQHVAAKKLRIASGLHVSGAMLPPQQTPGDAPRSSGCAFTDHREWAATGNEFDSLFRLGDFTHRPDSRIYESLFCLQDQWHEEFPQNRTRRSVFHMRDGPAVSRRFLSRYGSYMRIQSALFDMVAAPYMASGAFGKSIRYMVYLVPKTADADLAEVWKGFCSMADGGVGRLLEGCARVGLDLAVPMARCFSSSLDLREALRSTYGNGPAEYVDSRMAVCIENDCCGAEAAAKPSEVYPACEEFRVDRPHIALAYDGALDRILFVVKDMGHAGRYDD